ncbi:flagellar biosynthesis protein FlhB [Granulosicoccus sp.]|nr:flagellar biosynthesis protein FlhB [Granulosicoccus sp.]
MAGQDSAAERTQDATPKRIEEARKKGDVPRSKELNTVLMLLASVIGFAVLGSTGVNAYKQLARNQWHVERAHLFNDQALLNGLLVPFIEALWISAPFLLLMLIAVFIGPLCMGGWVFSTSSLKVDLKKVSPLAGLKRMFGVQTIAELVKSILKVLVLGILSVLMFSINIDNYLNLGALPLTEAVNSMFNIIFVILLVLIMSLSVVVLVDVPYQQWSYAKKLRMTFQEVKEENKESTGNPEVKAKVRQMQHSNANRKMLKDVPDADVIITNPEHFSVALRYDDKLVAPVVVAKGADLIALKIREIGKHHSVEIFEAPPLARALYRNSDIGETIPSELYLAVAQILAYVLQVKEASFADRGRLIRPTNLSVPPSLSDPTDK